MHAKSFFYAGSVLVAMSLLVGCKTYHPYSSRTQECLEIKQALLAGETNPNPIRTINGPYVSTLRPPQIRSVTAGRSINQLRLEYARLGCDVGHFDINRYPQK